MPHERSDFYIMKAHHLTSSGRKLGLRKILRDEPNCTIIIATRNYGYNKSVPCFIIGCQGDYGVGPGEQATYTIDTGNGYKMNGELLNIEHVLQITDGQVINQGTNVGPPQMDARYTWVMK